MAPKTLAVALIALLAITSPVLAQTSAAITGKTRTLHVTVGNERLRFEAPDGMCFADGNNRQQDAVLQLARRMLRHKGDEQLLGVFMPCDSIANPANPMAREGRVPSLGVILWPHKIEDRATRDTASTYLDWRAASFPEYAALNLPLWLLAADPFRQPDDTVADPEISGDSRHTATSLSTAYAQYLSADGQPFPTVGGIGTILINGHPIDIALRLNAASGVTTIDQAHEFMENFMELQARINR